MTDRPSPILRWFDFAHLPEHLQPTSAEFYNLAHRLEIVLPNGEQKSMALQNLLYAKDAAVRATIELTERA